MTCLSAVSFLSDIILTLWLWNAGGENLKWRLRHFMVGFWGKITSSILPNEDNSLKDTSLSVCCLVRAAQHQTLCGQVNVSNALDSSEIVYSKKKMLTETLTCLIHSPLLYHVTPLDTWILLPSSKKTEPSKSAKSNLYFSRPPLTHISSPLKTTSDLPPYDKQYSIVSEI